jgi:CRP/FNR family cyclic AMP-dependent transcriptional regulator
MVAKIQSLKNVPIFSSLSEPHLEELSDIALEKTYRKNQVIFDQGDPGSSLIVIKSGLVKISLVDSNNHEFIIKTFSVNDFFGEMSLLDGGARSATATAVEDTHALIIFRQNFIGLIQKTPAMALGMLTELSDRLRVTTENISNLTFFDAYGKVAQCLLSLADKLGTREEDGVTMQLTLSRQELANMSGLSRETFARILKEFQVRGCLKVQGKKIVILNEKVMRREIIV